MAPKSLWKKTANNQNATKSNADQTGLPAINYAEVQDEEVEVLKAIYMEDFEDVEIKNAWSKTTDRSFKLKLRAFSEETSFVMLSVMLTASYPKSAPVLDISGVERYHERTQKRIRNVIHNRPKQLLGEVMIHAIATEIQEALEDAVLARQQGTLPSLEEERASAEEIATALAKEAEEAEVQRAREAEAEENRVLKQMVDEEVSRRDRRKSMKVVASPATASAASGPEIIYFDQPAVVQVENESMPFNAVDLLNVIFRRRDETVHLAKPQIEGTSIVPLVTVKRLNMEKSRNEVMEIESTLEQVCKLRNDNILNLLAYRVDRVEPLATQLVICNQYADRGTLQDLLDLGSLHVSKARQFTTSLLEGLDYLHRNGVSHGNLSCRTILMVGRSTITPRLADFGYVWMVHENDSGLSAKWQTPEGREVASALKRKSDIWSLGVVIVQMFLGLQITADHASPQAMLSRLDFSDPFNDFARKLFTIDPKKRPSAFDLLPVEFLRTDATVLDEDTLAVPGRSMVGFGSMSPGARRSRHNSSGFMEPASRYATDFTEVGRLGRGGFGEVVKARNKLDGGIYAVKKIKQAPQLLDRVLSEVMLLNRLNHPYVVRYFSTWVENDLSSAISEEAVSTTDYTSQTRDDDDDDDDTSDGPRMDFGYQSTGGLDFVSSTGYPQIQFGDDDDDDSENDPFERDDEDTDGQMIMGSDAATESAKGFEARPLFMRKSRSDSRLPSVLYIQMEYCERQTLRDLIRRGMSTDDSWRYVRQVTEGLSHIHSHGIIHRDLKPDNVFIDVTGNPKIGDFGLATTGQYQVADKPSAISGGPSYGDLTRSVGTALYVAPELRSGSGTSYNDKVDMYSLGVMFFEMCEVFGTAMERIKALQYIREKDHELSQEFKPTGEKSAQGKLITCLISHKPSDRPSSTELLRSDILPVKIEDETIRQALSGLSDPRSPYHQKMMSALFAHDTASAGRVKALAWDAKGASGPEDGNKLRLRGIARRTLANIFRRHGAEETRRESIFPRSGYYVNANVVQLLDASGNLLQMPYDLTLPHARQLARQSPAVKKTFVFGSAYRDAFTGGPPRVNDEVDFDIVCSASDDERAFDDAEVLKVMDEITCETPMFASSTALSFHINHVNVLDVILEYCRVPTAQQTAVKEVLSRLGFYQWNWTKMRAELRKFGLADTSLEDLQQFDFRDIPDKAIMRVRQLLQGGSVRLKQKLEDGIESLKDILNAASQLSIQRKIFFSPLASVNAKFYDGGMLFQCVLDRKSNRIVIAAGGRYDSLIRAYRPVDARASSSGAVGVSIGLDPIVAYMSKSYSDSTKASILKDSTQNSERYKRCEVLVVANGTESVRLAGIKILTSLWANDIRAELAPSTRAIGDDTEHNFVVTIRHEGANTVRVVTTGADGEETDIPVISLVSHLQHEIRDRDGHKAARAPAFIRQTSHQDGERRGNVQVLMAQYRSKKSNKYTIVDAAQQRWHEKIDEWKNAPILAVETRDDVLELLRETRLGDTETWRRALQSVQLNERQYVQQVQDILNSWRKSWSNGEGMREACIFNFRTGNCIYYDLGV
ncbi:Serine/threonine-protein kinase [Acrodontium crateriforme]|uniref:non-specific serine/threonine protein kinase n=1 Tax=Acrodontium crateriforme TaxID=150365 RepID=A0AAQ3LXU3_9PEZI|nr:Serine/threonine-protein kinase [Acrodontium crateriforme]